MNLRGGGIAAVVLRPIATIAIVAVAAACAPAPTTSEPPPTGTRSSDPAAVCALLPDLAAVVGREPLASPSGFATETSDRCLWVMGRDPSRYVGLTVGEVTNHAKTIDAFGPGEAVAGLGDDARWWAANRTLSFVTGDRSYQVDLQLDAAEATRELAVAIAGRVLAALGVP